MNGPLDKRLRYRARETARHTDDPVVAVADLEHLGLQIVAFQVARPLCADGKRCGRAGLAGHNPIARQVHEEHLPIAAVRLHGDDGLLPIEIHGGQGIDQTSRSRQAEQHT